MIRFGKLAFCALVIVSSASAFGEELPNLDAALKCPDGMLPVTSCSQYRQAQDQNLWIRFCEVPGTTSLDSTNIALVLATKTADLYMRELATYAGFNENTKSVAMRGEVSAVKCEGNASGPCSSYLEYEYGKDTNQPYTNHMNTMLYTTVKNGNSTSNLGVSVEQNQFNCWAEHN
jgi:hypothetical protein